MPRHRSPLNCPTSWMLPLLLLTAAVSPAFAQAQRAHVGARIGVNFDSNDLVLGGHALIPVTKQLEVYPSLDVYFPDEGTLLGFNGDLKWRFPAGTGLDVYLGGGLNVLYSDVDGESDSSVGANLLGGLETRQGQIHPFVEGRALIHDNSSFQLMGGINITLGRHSP